MYSAYISLAVCMYYKHKENVFILFTVSSDEQFLILMASKISVFSFLVSNFCLLLK